ncbi:MAG: acid stress-induced BolA-like protein IbaG/YrbA [Candidatus Endobugula sp.]|jgi:acid stress-induced BolA-like protein IbaG/YrbA
MEPDAIKSLLHEHITNATIDVTVEGSHVAVHVVSDDFEGLNTLKRHQKVYSVLSEHIASGVIHAVNMKTFTLQESSL